MRHLTPGEILSLREFMTMETTGLVSLKASKPLISDQELAQACDVGIAAAESRIRALQQFIQENGVADIRGVE